MGRDIKSPEQKTNNINDDNMKAEQSKVSTSVESNRSFMQKKKTNPKMKIGVIVVAGIVLLAIVLAVVLAITGSNNAQESQKDEHSYEQYDLKGLTVADACEKAKGAGWEVNRVVAREGDDKTDCYNEEIIVTYYDYYDYNHSVTIYFGEKKTEEEKKSECESSGKWYRDGQCKTEEEWENDYAWKNAHAACKKYGANAYAKTLTDCYVGNDYQGPVDGQPADNSSSSSSESNSTNESNTSSNATWRQVLSEYEAWMNKYIDFMAKYKNTTDNSARISMMSEYSTLMTEMSEWTQKLDSVKGNLSTSDLNEYVQALTRINQRLSEIQ